MSAPKPTTHDPYRGCVEYRLPNGVGVSVIPDPRRPLRWEALASNNPSPHPGLTSTEVELLLDALAEGDS